MRADIDKYYELLGVKPGVSVADLKAAHRDLAKVWHPDRFGHDERLQKKAQEKLKEINEAYEILISGKVPRPTPNPSSSNEPPRPSYKYESSYSAAPPVKKSSSVPIHWVIVPLLIFGAVFFAASRFRFRAQPVNESSPTQTQTEQPTLADKSESRAPTDVASRNRNRAETETEPKETSTDNPAVAPSTTKLQPMLITTVMIDPSTGLLARAECPVKTRISYTAGNEPHGYCNAVHGAKTAQSENKDSAVKNLAKKVVAPKKWLGSGGGQ